MDRGIKVIEKFTVALEDLRLIIRLCELIVYIKELYRFGINTVRQTADTVPVHFSVGNTLLDCLRSVFQSGKKAGLFLRRLGV